MITDQIVELIETEIERYRLEAEKESDEVKKRENRLIAEAIQKLLETLCDLEFS